MKPHPFFALAFASLSAKLTAPPGPTMAPETKAAADLVRRCQLDVNATGKIQAALVSKLKTTASDAITAGGLSMDASDSINAAFGQLDDAIAKQDQGGALSALESIASALGFSSSPAPAAPPPPSGTVATSARLETIARRRAIASLDARKARARRSFASLSMATSTAPTSFRIFKAGWNVTSKGTFLFDAEAASAVMAEYSRTGNELPIDLEHLSLDSGAANYDPDARGWVRLELRNGELWAICSWTPDGQARLANKTQRYISPTFGYDRETKRVTLVHNIALVAQPATHKAPPLVPAGAA